MLTTGTCQPRSPRPPSLRASGLLAVACVLGWSGRACAQPFAYVTNKHSNAVSVIDTRTNLVVATIPVGQSPSDVVAAPDGRLVYVTNGSDRSNSVSVIDTATNKVTATVAVGSNPL